MTETIGPSRFIYAFLRNTTTGGSFDLNVNATSTALQNFFFEVPTDKIFQLMRVNILILDAGIRPSKFGAEAALTNGIVIETVGTDNSATTLDFCDGDTIKRNAEFVYLAGVDNIILDAAADDSLSVRITVDGSTGLPCELKAGQRFQFGIQDDLSGLAQFRVMIQGKLEDA